MVLSELSTAGGKVQICLRRVRLAHELPQMRQSAAALRLVTQGLSSLRSGHILYAHTHGYIPWHANTVLGEPQISPQLPSCSTRPASPTSWKVP